jgi:hypothetical protein
MPSHFEAPASSPPADLQPGASAEIAHQAVNPDIQGTASASAMNPPNAVPQRVSASKAGRRASKVDEKSPHKADSAAGEIADPWAK